MSDRNYRRTASGYGETHYGTPTNNKSSPYGESISGTYTVDPSASYPSSAKRPTRKSADEGYAIAIVVLALGLVGTAAGTIIGTYYGLSHNHPGQVFLTYSLIGCVIGFPILFALAITALIVALIISSIWDKWFWRYEPRQAVMLFATGIFAAILGRLLRKNSTLGIGILGLLVHLLCVYTFSKLHNFVNRRRYFIFRTRSEH
jgi:MFS family permease